ncbi:hypothetical protein D3C83_277750 [compost metagenome]
MTMRSPPTEAEAAELMSRYGITRVPADQFHYQSFRYSKLADAAAQARRDADRSGA